MMIDGAELDLFHKQMVETIAFVDRQYLGLITTKSGSSLYYASLMIRSVEDAIPEFGMPAWPVWAAHTLHGE